LPINNLIPSMSASEVHLLFINRTDTPLGSVNSEDENELLPYRVTL